MTVKMTRNAEQFPAPHEADVHPSEVENYAAAGWQIAEELKAAPQTKGKAKKAGG